jgi:hypothetical protein
MSVRNQPKIHEANRRPKGRHPSFCFRSFIGIYYPLTDIVIVHIVCNPTPLPTSLLYISFAILPPIPPPIHDCAYGALITFDCAYGAFYYLGSECDHLPEAVNNI